MDELRRKETGARLKELRLEKNLTLASLASKLGVSRICLSKVEKGESDLPCKALVTCSDIFGVSTDYILGLSTYSEYMIETARSTGLSLKEVNAYILRKALDER